MIGTAHGSALGFAGGVAVTAAAGSWPVFDLVLLVLVVGTVSWWTTVAGSALTVVQCWGLYASFVVGHDGHLVLDWPALAVLAVAGCASLGGLVRQRVPAAPAPRSSVESGGR
ncbi:hypothetical protein [Saccharothrix syringae]|uniref:Uncharacterized protein n=1 Tax=Saccharothrix syringae TaxID=103733 RepID=A0A5Q0GRR1_SACSY|nr:hypothetical protein [Saccharothrix syringae]QFZ16603.1 hypothetical protein EKG83_03180 [Saccharothrix syringae]